MSAPWCPDCEVAHWPGRCDEVMEFITALHDARQKPTEVDIPLFCAECGHEQHEGECVACRVLVVSLDHCARCGGEEGTTALRRFVRDHEGIPWHEGCAADAQHERGRDSPLFGSISEPDAQDIIDAGRGHLL